MLDVFVSSLLTPPIDFNSKPFACGHCGKTYGRQDVLRRHTKLHTRESIQKTSTTTSSLQHDRPTSPPASPRPWPVEPDMGHRTPVACFELPDSTGANIPIDSGNFLEWLIPDIHTSPAASPPLLDISMLSPVQTVTGYQPGQPGDQRSHVAYEAGQTAVRQISSLVDDLCNSLSSDAQTTGATSAFFDACLHEYFERVSPCFPILHAPTFRAQDCIPPLLLNIYALGALFVTQAGSRKQADILWRLAHTAVATSWNSVITQKGPYDTCDGVQLVLTALLGQTYALLSNSPGIRRTAFVFHGLGFYWARTSGMYNLKPFPLADLPNSDTPEEEKLCRWKSWAALETQRRAILGHYILDGLIAQSSGFAPSARHVVNSIGTACTEAAFSAQTVGDWVIAMQGSLIVEQPMSTVYASLFRLDYVSSPTPLSEFSISVVLEGLQSLVSDLQEAISPAVGVVPQREIISALINLYEGSMMTIGSHPTPDRLPLLLRWHTICLELAVPSAVLFETIRSSHKSLRCPNWTPINSPHRRLTDLEQWSQSAAGMRALLHAIAIKQLLSELPLSRALSPHIPNAIFSSAVVFGAMCLCDTCTVKLPTHFLWNDAWSTILQQEPDMSQFTLKPNNEDIGVTSDDVLKQLEAGGSVQKRSVNLLKDINFLQLSLATIASRWTLSIDLENIIGQLGRLAREKLAGSL